MPLVFPVDSYVGFNDFISHVVFLPSGFPTKSCVLLNPYMCFDFITVVIFGEDYKL